MTDTPQGLLEQDLDEYMDGGAWPQPMADRPDQPVPITDPELADKIVHRLGRLHREEAEITALVEARVARLHEWQADRLAGVQKDISWAERALEAYARNQAVATGRKRVTLTEGAQLRLTDPGKGRVIVTDETAFVAYVDANHLDAHLDAGPDGEKPLPPLVTRPPQVHKVAIGTRLRSTEEPLSTTEGPDGTWHVYGYVTRWGELVPGVERHVLAQPRFSVDLPEVAK